MVKDLHGHFSKKDTNGQENEKMFIIICHLGNVQIKTTEILHTY